MKHPADRTVRRGEAIVNECSRRPQKVMSQVSGVKTRVCGEYTYGLISHQIKNEGVEGNESLFRIPERETTAVEIGKGERPSYEEEMNIFRTAHVGKDGKVAREEDGHNMTPDGRAGSERFMIPQGRIANLTLIKYISSTLRLKGAWSGNETRMISGAPQGERREKVIDHRSQYQWTRRNETGRSETARRPTKPRWFMRQSHATWWLDLGGETIGEWRVKERGAESQRDALKKGSTTLPERGGFVSPRRTKAREWIHGASERDSRRSCVMADEDQVVVGGSVTQIYDVGPRDPASWEPRVVLMRIADLWLEHDKYGLGPRENRDLDADCANGLGSETMNGRGVRRGEKKMRCESAVKNEIYQKKKGGKRMDVNSRNPKRI
ncbi:hypothetical protein DFS33DRAFT_1434722 [Desarmillaria ectypa]|nr:hypothetical protein DFS33DRAFT_1434722 [Desarmillaria ectypa]